MEEAREFRVTAKIAFPDKDLQQIWVPDDSNPQNKCRSMIAPYYFMDMKSRKLLSLSRSKITWVDDTPRGNANYGKYHITVFVDGVRKYKTVSKHCLLWALYGDPSMVLGVKTYDLIMSQGLYAFGSGLTSAHIHHIKTVQYGDDPDELIAVSHRLHNVI